MFVHHLRVFSENILKFLPDSVCLKFCRISWPGLPTLLHERCSRLSSSEKCEIKTMEINKFPSISLLYLCECLPLGERAWKIKVLSFRVLLLESELWKVFSLRSRWFLVRKSPQKLIENLWGAVIDRILCQWIREPSLGKKKTIMRWKSKTAMPARPHYE